MLGRVGFACKVMHPDQSLKPKLLLEYQSQYCESITTVAWLNRQTRDAAEQKLLDLMVKNIQSLRNLIEYAGALPETQRMVRIGSGLLPVYTEPTWSYFWKRSDIIDYCQREYAKLGELARQLDVRLSMHPGQFVVLASENPDIVNRSIEEFEYHANIVRWMGYGKRFQDFKINVHISGRRGPAGIIETLQRLSPEARNCITIENDENAWGIDASIELAQHCALVLDVHHHWCREGEYISPSDHRVSRIIESWRGVRPVMHYSVSRRELLADHPTDVRPDIQQLYAQGYKKAKLRAHSDTMWNSAVNEWAAGFRHNFDIMVEAKSKNLASIPFELASRN